MGKKSLFALVAMAAFCVTALAQTMPIQIFEDSQSAPLWKEDGDAFSAQGQFEEAIKCYDIALQMAPSDAEIWTGKGFALCDLGRFNESLSCMDRAIELGPRKQAAWNNKGTVFDAMGNYEEALKCREIALKIDPRLNNGLAQ